MDYGPWLETSRFQQQALDQGIIPWELPPLTPTEIKALCARKTGPCSLRFLDKLFVRKNKCCGVPQTIDRLLMLRALQYTKLIRKQDNMSGYMGKVLWVDLENKQFIEETIPEEIYQEYLSGMGLAAHLLYEHIPPEADPLGPENVLGFVSGLLTGTPSLFSGRWMAVGKSPLTRHLG
jgi:hypothetical protein